MSDNGDDILSDTSSHNECNGLNQDDGRDRNHRRFNEGLAPLDSSLMGRSIMTQHQRITLARLFDEDTMNDMDLNFIYVQLMKIMVPSSAHGTNSAYVY
eukprot:9844171-Ditylum_brightwellii.AAC.1